jgi:P27 family predicted phage terminase small subunit
MSQAISRSFGPGSATGPTRAPTHLSRGGRRWWRAVVEAYDLETHHLVILTAAAEAWDRKEQARGLIAEEGIVIRNVAGERVTHPAVQVEDTASRRLASLIRDLGLDATPPQDVRLP